LSSPSTSQIARSIHDGIAQDLVALGYSLDQALGAPELPTSTRVELRTLRFGVTELIEKVRREILNLRNPLPALPLIAAEICGELLGEVELEVDLPDSLFSVVSELLRNAVNHSGASVINLHTYQSNAFAVIEVSDNGIGNVKLKSNRYGLSGVAEVVAELSGQIEFINLTPGLLIRVSIPA